jgi:hypothetical protein
MTASLATDLRRADAVVAGMLLGDRDEPRPFPLVLGTGGRGHRQGFEATKLTDTPLVSALLLARCVRLG